MSNKTALPQMCDRFRGYLPVVIDVETAGVDPNSDALLEIGMVMLDMDERGLLTPGASSHQHVLPYEGSNLNPDALAFNQIDPYHPFRFAVEEQIALTELQTSIKKALKRYRCKRAVLVGHNAWFDLLFIRNAYQRARLHFPFHSFTSLDTATLAAACYGQTVLAKALECADIPFDKAQAHSALYDAQKTAELFCKMINSMPIQ